MNLVTKKLEKEEMVNIVTREKVNKLQNMPQVDIPLEHLFVDGMYCRSGILPKDSFIIGRIHKKDVINVLSKGKMLMKTSIDDEGIIIEGPYIGETKAGSRKILYILEDCYFMNIMRVEATTPEEADVECAVPVDESLEILIKEKEVICG